MPEHISVTTGVSVGSQFYDLRDREIGALRAQAVVAALADHDLVPDRGVLDFGAGTGIATMTFADAWPALPIYAIEPSAPMRTALLTNISARQDLRSRITVYPLEITKVRRREFVDLVCSFWSITMVHRDVLLHTLEAIRDSLIPEGVFIVETPSAVPQGEEVQDFSYTMRLGEHEITHRNLVVEHEDGSTESTFSYCWRDADGRVLYEDADRYLREAGTRLELGQSLQVCGFEPIFDFDDPAGGSFTAYRVGPPSAKDPR